MKISLLLCDVCYFAEDDEEEKDGIDPVIIIIIVSAVVGVAFGVIIAGFVVSVIVFKTVKKSKEPRPGHIEGEMEKLEHAEGETHEMEYPKHAEGETHEMEEPEHAEEETHEIEPEHAEEESHENET